MSMVDFIPAITIWQPWATLLTRGLKVHETCSWCPRRKVVGRRLAIHAGAHKIDTLEIDEDALWQLYDEDIDLESLPYGAVVGTARLVAVHRTEDRRRLVSYAEVELGDWSPGRFAWEMEDPIEFSEPIPCRGAQKIWDWAPVEGTCLVCGAADDKCPGGVIWADESRRLCGESECRRLALAGGMIG